MCYTVYLGQKLDLTMLSCIILLYTEVIVYGITPASSAIDSTAWSI